MDALEHFGEIDIYLFDQILKDRFNPSMRILDAGCGGGRNLIYFLRNNYEVFGIDENPDAIEYVRSLAKSVSSASLEKNFEVSRVEKMPFADNFFELIISSAVLHFAKNETHFDRMFAEMWRVLKPNGMLFARLASNIGIENRVRLVAERRFQLPDGSERFLVNEEMLTKKAKERNATFIEPIRTTNVQNQRCMTTLVLQKKHSQNFHDGLS